MISASVNTNGCHHMPATKPTLSKDEWEDASKSRMHSAYSGMVKGTSRAAAIFKSKKSSP